MAYVSEGRLPFEKASKLGHLKIIESEWVNALIKDFETFDVTEKGIFDNQIWRDYDCKSARTVKAYLGFGWFIC